MNTAVSAIIKLTFVAAMVSPSSGLSFKKKKASGKDNSHDDEDDDDIIVSEALTCEEIVESNRIASASWAKTKTDPSRLHELMLKQ